MKFLSLAFLAAMLFGDVSVASSAVDFKVFPYVIWSYKGPNGRENPQTRYGLSKQDDGEYWIFRSLKPAEPGHPTLVCCEDIRVRKNKEQWGTIFDYTGSEFDSRRYSENDFQRKASDVRVIELRDGRKIYVERREINRLSGTGMTVRDLTGVLHPLTNPQILQVRSPVPGEKTGSIELFEDRERPPEFANVPDPQHGSSNSFHLSGSLNEAIDTLPESASSKGNIAAEILNSPKADTLLSEMHRQLSTYSDFAKAYPDASSYIRDFKELFGPCQHGYAESLLPDGTKKRVDLEETPDGAPFYHRRIGTGADARVVRISCRDMSVNDVDPNELVSYAKGDAADCCSSEVPVAWPLSDQEWQNLSDKERVAFSECQANPPPNLFSSECAVEAACDMVKGAIQMPLMPFIGGAIGADYASRTAGEATERKFFNWTSELHQTALNKAKQGGFPSCINPIESSCLTTMMSAAFSWMFESVLGLGKLAVDAAIGVFKGWVKAHAAVVDAGAWLIEKTTGFRAYEDSLASQVHVISQESSDTLGKVWNDIGKNGFGDFAWNAMSRLGEFILRSAKNEFACKQRGYVKRDSVTQRLITSGEKNSGKTFESYECLETYPGILECADCEQKMKMICAFGGVIGSEVALGIITGGTDIGAQVIGLGAKGADVATKIIPGLSRMAASLADKSAKGGVLMKAALLTPRAAVKIAQAEAYAVKGIGKALHFIVLGNPVSSALMNVAGRVAGAAAVPLRLTIFAPAELGFHLASTGSPRAAMKAWALSMADDLLFRVPSAIRMRMIAPRQVEGGTVARKLSDLGLEKNATSAADDLRFRQEVLRVGDDEPIHGLRVMHRHTDGSEIPVTIEGYFVPKDVGAELIKRFGARKEGAPLLPVPTHQWLEQVAVTVAKDGNGLKAGQRLVVRTNTITSETAARLRKFKTEILGIDDAAAIEGRAIFVRTPEGKLVRGEIVGLKAPVKTGDAMQWDGGVSIRFIESGVSKEKSRRIIVSVDQFEKQDGRIVATVLDSKAKPRVVALGTTSAGNISPELQKRLSDWKKTLGVADDADVRGFEGIVTLEDGTKVRARIENLGFQSASKEGAEATAAGWTGDVQVKLLEKAGGKTPHKKGASITVKAETISAKPPANIDALRTRLNLKGSDTVVGQKVTVVAKVKTTSGSEREVRYSAEVVSEKAGMFRTDQMTVKPLEQGAGIPKGNQTVHLENIQAPSIRTVGNLLDSSIKVDSASAGRFRHLLLELDFEKDASIAGTKAFVQMEDNLVQVEILGARYQGDSSNLIKWDGSVSVKVIDSNAVKYANEEIVVNLSQITKSRKEIEEFQLAYAKARTQRGRLGKVTDEEYKALQKIVDHHDSRLFARLGEADNSRVIGMEVMVEGVARDGKVVTFKGKIKGRPALDKKVTGISQGEGKVLIEPVKEGLPADFPKELMNTGLHPISAINPIAGGA